MTTYSVRYVHKISPKDTDTRPDIELPTSALSDCRALARALRSLGVLESGARLRSFRAEGDKVVCFPDRGVWHSIILTH